MTPKSLIEPARHAGTALLRSQTDARLVDLTRDGNERAFEAIVQRYHRPLLRYCARILSPTRAEDAVQQAFLSAHRSIHAGDAELNLRPWLYRIAHNAALNLLRQNGFDHEEMSEEIDGVDTPPQIFERSERLRAVMAAVQDLPERQRDAIVLQAMEGRSYEEIALELGVSDGAVRQLLNRARNTLREAAAAITPTGLLTRIASSGGEASVAERVAQVVSSAGGGALLVKAGAALVVAGAVTGGAVTGTLPVPGGHHAPSKAIAEPLPASGGSAAGAARAQVGPGGRPHVVQLSGGSAGGSGGASKRRRGGGRRSASGTRAPGGGRNPGPSGGGHNSGSGSGSSGSGDHSGPGSSGSGSSGSGSRDGGGSSGSDGGGGHSGSGDGGTSGSLSSGSGSGSSGSGDGGGSSSGSGSGSGSGGGSDGSGSSGSGETLLSTPSTSGSDGSGSGDSGSPSGGHDGSGSSGRH